MAHKKAVKYSKALANRIAEAVAGGTSVRALCKSSDKYPDAKTVYRWQRSHEDFNDKMSNAYDSYMHGLLGELDDLSSGLASDHYPSADFREAEAALKRRIDAVKFMVAKAAPQLSKRWERKSAAADDIPTQYIVMNYSTLKDSHKTDIKQQNDDAIDGEVVYTQEETKRLEKDND